jgi:hypothetical protein
MLGDDDDDDDGFLMVMEQFWETSNHCALLKMNPDDYRRAIRDFVAVAAVPKSKYL